jgi:hypothetical protein
VAVETWQQRPFLGEPPPLGSSFVLWVLLTMLLILLVAGVVAAYAAFTHRGADMPAVPWVGDVLERAASAVPTLPGDQPRQLQ